MQAIFSTLVAFLGHLLHAPGKILGRGVAGLRSAIQLLVLIASVSTAAISGCDVSKSIGVMQFDEDSTSEEWSVLHHDFGVVAPGTKLEHRFPIHNRSARQISIDKLINTCSCTATVSSAKHINPGEVEYVTVNYLTG